MAELNSTVSISSIRLASQLYHMLKDSIYWEYDLHFNRAPPYTTPDVINLDTFLDTGIDLTFPGRFSGISTRSYLIDELKLSGIKSGFTIYQCPSKTQSQLKKSKISSLHMFLLCLSLYLQ